MICFAYLWLFILNQASAVCYFPAEVQGTYDTQSTITHTNEINYSDIVITEDSIPIWGQCHKRLDNNIIFQIGSDETVCFRCFYITLIAINVLSVHLSDKDYMSRCYTNETKAIESCFLPSFFTNNQTYTEIMLYKKLDLDGKRVQREYCPFNAHYNVTYIMSDETDNHIECLGKVSEMDSCPSGSALNFRFRRCPLENRKITFECLGSWEDHKHQKYVAMMNVGQDSLGPKYRCARYDEHPGTGTIKIAFSSDSTCTSIAPDSDRMQDIFGLEEERMIIHSSNTFAWPEHQKYCRLPSWLYGEWEHLSITSDTIIYRDHSSFKTYTMKCIETVSDNKVNETKFIVFSKTQCDEKQYQCVRFAQRSSNIIEFQIGAKIEQNYDDSMNSICQDRYFNMYWITQSRNDYNLKQVPCPLNGQFVGILPDAPDLCTKLSTDCDSPDIMYYVVSACKYDLKFEERKYQCMGNWRDGNVMYTYTKRLDVVKYECFVGIQLSNQQIFINEAGQHCQRSIDPTKYGMKMERIDSCIKNGTYAMDFYYTQTHLQDLNQNFSNDLSNMTSFTQNTLHLEMTLMHNSSSKDPPHELYLLENDSRVPNKSNKFGNTANRQDNVTQFSNSKSDENETITRVNDTINTVVKPSNLSVKSIPINSRITSSTSKTVTLRTTTTTTAKTSLDAKVDNKEETRAMGNTGCAVNLYFYTILMTFVTIVFHKTF